MSRITVLMITSFENDPKRCLYCLPLVQFFFNSILFGQFATVLLPLRRPPKWFLFQLTVIPVTLFKKGHISNIGSMYRIVSHTVLRTFSIFVQANISQTISAIKAHTLIGQFQLFHCSIVQHTIFISKLLISTIQCSHFHFTASPYQLQLVVQRKFTHRRQ